jgi:hypothetical protein
VHFHGYLKNMNIVTIRENETSWEKVLVQVPYKTETQEGGSNDRCKWRQPAYERRLMELREKHHASKCVAYCGMRGKSPRRSPQASKSSSPRSLSHSPKTQPTPSLSLKRQSKPFSPRRRSRSPKTQPRLTLQRTHSSRTMHGASNDPKFEVMDVAFSLDYGIFSTIEESTCTSSEGFCYPDKQLVPGGYWYIIWSKHLNLVGEKRYLADSVKDEKLKTDILVKVSKWRRAGSCGILIWATFYQGILTEEVIGFCELKKTVDCLGKICRH